MNAVKPSPKIAELKKLLKKHRASWSTMCEDTGLTWHWCRSVLEGKIKDPGVSRLEAALAWLSKD